MARTKGTTPRWPNSQAGDPDQMLLRGPSGPLVYPSTWAPGGRGHPSQARSSASASERSPLPAPIRIREAASRPLSGKQPSEPCSAQRSATRPRFSTSGFPITAVPGQTRTKQHRRLIASARPKPQAPCVQPQSACQPAQPPRSIRPPKLPNLCDLLSSKEPLGCPAASDKEVYFGRVTIVTIPVRASLSW